MSQYINDNFFDTSSEMNSQFFAENSQVLSTFFTANDNLSSQLHTFPIFDSENDSLMESPNRTEKNLNNSMVLFSDDEDDQSMSESPEKNSNKLMTQYSQKSQEVTHDKTQSNPLTKTIFSVDENIAALPNVIIEIYSEVKKEYSNFTFTSIIAGQLCTDIFPLGAYNHLKLALLMSIVSDKMLNIMAIGREVTHASTIMDHIGVYSQRFLRISNFDAITVNNNQVIEAGPLAIATNGIGFLGNWQRIPQKASIKLLREIETKMILLDKIQIHYPMRTTVWTYWNFTSKLKKDLASISQFIKYDIN